jgi:hypothetical protein
VEAVFSSSENAQQYIEKAQLGRLSPQIVKHNVLGDMGSPDTVYSSWLYDQHSDTRSFGRVYGTYEAAKEAAGKNGLVETWIIDKKVS